MAALETKGKQDNVNKPGKPPGPTGPIVSSKKDVIPPISTEPLTLALYGRGAQLRRQNKHAEAYAILSRFANTELDDAEYWNQMAPLYWHLDKPKGRYYMYKLMSSMREPGVARYVRNNALNICGTLSWYGYHPWHKDFEFLKSEDDNKGSYASPKLWEKPVVAILARDSYKDWEAAEAATMGLAKELVAAGYRVVVYGAPQQDAIIPSGSLGLTAASATDPSENDVLWPWCNPCIVPHEHFTRSVNNGSAGKNEFAAIISWEDVKPIGNAKKRIRWAHDLSAAKLPVDNVVCVSPYQRQRVAPENKTCIVIPYEVDMSATDDSKTSRKPLACVYADHYTKGLEPLLMMWPFIHEKWPAATLAVYGGWQAGYAYTPGWRQRIEKMLVDLKKQGVTETRGPVKWNLYTFWLRPSTTFDVFCASAVQAQAGGCIPVTCQLGALKDCVVTGFNCDELKNYVDQLDVAFGTDAPLLAKMSNFATSILETYKQKAITDKWLSILSP